jgi:hypothetical protein
MIIIYQLDAGDICRFIYRKPSGNLEVVSCENYRGMDDFLRYSDAQRISNEIDIYEKLNELKVVA